MNWMIMPFRRYFDFKGRSRRMEFWMFALLNTIVWIVLTMVQLGSTGGMAQMASLDESNPFAIYGILFSGAFGILIALWGLATIIPSIAVTIRRLHDRDMSGWWYLGVIVGSLIPLINILVSLGFLVLMLLPGTPGPNRFGPDPKDPTSAEVFA
ncbi:uncharacterized membrane protein YhaH (DUF805 family) [Novosphingobium kunmingense]|uniref:Uncharacterized membrane protein YhaH (DUF805 family) n=1 Tax=Novosphingobium kunmingense TaxID=1211806 RepID=A0A2N0HL02_9SPHN|nr:DUF805 domain-containing protein [Novosphingobium kunmingense]PKB19612.1 uncharacterized membrane protein YhaH (DUF805 family) [Novosphingobium kunmingense]